MPQIKIQAAARLRAASGDYVSGPASYTFATRESLAAKSAEVLHKKSFKLIKGAHMRVGHYSLIVLGLSTSDTGRRATDVGVCKMYTQLRADGDDIEPGSEFWDDEVKDRREIMKIALEALSAVRHPMEAEVNKDAKALLAIFK